ncbi:MAG: glycosyltransferase [Bacilli bacterium]
MKISIIVPIYNVENYLHKSIDSIINQTYENIEIILVNDGSTDNSLIIVQDYANTDARIIVIDQKNKGVSCARNSGISAATGKYILFVDPDDFIEENMVYVLINNINGCDIIFCGYKFHNNRCVELVDANFQEDNELFFSKLINGETIGVVWRCLFKRSFISSNKLSFDEECKIGEDLLFILNALIYTNNYKFINDHLYNYVIHFKSTTNRKKEDLDIIFQTLLYKIKLLLKNNNIHTVYENDLNLRVYTFINGLIINEISASAITISYKDSYKYIRNIINNIQYMTTKTYYRDIDTKRLVLYKLYQYRLYNLLVLYYKYYIRGRIKK